MSTPTHIAEIIQNLPKKAGVYQYYDKNNRLLYIGKAKNLRNRVSSYFRNPSSQTKKVNKLLKNIKGIEITITNTELEALLMEQYLIKEKKPIFNVQFKDDKGYPWIKIEISKEFPAAKSFLGKKNLL